MGSRRVMLEVDNKNVVRCLQDLTSHVNKHWHILQLIFQYLDKPWDIKVQHSYRDGNRAADWMAGQALRLPLGSHFTLIRPAGIGTILNEDVRGVSLPRLCAL
ncbi:hypothetical protein Scep_007609 [Stephania cephalantha]|uniref:RNase H type-1 domain-containing protein n=1 Tax=Stephania cephalantha TaxID=152367 RepID=A0AAP0PLZ0_9MAGN